MAKPEGLRVTTTTTRPASLPRWLPDLHGERFDFTNGNSMPLVPAGGIHRSSSALWLPTHRHRHWELHYVHRGRMRLELPTNGGVANLDVPGGWFCLTAPGRVHRGQDGLLPPAQLLWLQLCPEQARARMGTPFSAADLQVLRSQLAQRAEHAWPAPPAMAEVFARLGALLASGARGLDGAGVRNALSQVLMLAGQPGVVDPLPAALAAACAALARQPTQPCTVAAAARAAGISAAHLHELCVRHLGSTPAAWQLTLRLDLARARLVQGQSVALVAAALGFSSPRYFAHAFRREVGVQPSGYAELRRLALVEPSRDW